MGNRRESHLLHRRGGSASPPLVSKIGTSILLMKKGQETTEKRAELWKKQIPTRRALQSKTHYTIHLQYYRYTKETGSLEGP